MRTETAATTGAASCAPGPHSGQLDAELPLEDLWPEWPAFRPTISIVFRGHGGRAGAEYVRRLRLERAAHRLKRQDQAVTDWPSKRIRNRTKPSPARSTGFWEWRHPNTAPPPESPSRRASMTTSPVPAAQLRQSRAVEVRTLRPERVIFLRHTGPYERVSGTWQRLAAWAARAVCSARHALHRNLMGRSRHHSGGELRYDAASREPSGPTARDIGVTELAGTARTPPWCTRPYETLGGAYRALFGGWLPESGRELRDDPCLEFYLNSLRHPPRRPVNRDPRAPGVTPAGRRKLLSDSLHAGTGARVRRLVHDRRCTERRVRHHR